MYFCNYKNNKQTNCKFNEVFATRRRFNVKFGTVFFLTSLAIFGKIERFSSRLSRFPTKKFEIFTSQTEAHPGFGKGGGHNRGSEGEAGKGGRFSHKKNTHFNTLFQRKSAVTRDNAKIISQLTVCLKAEAWPKYVKGGCNHYQFEKL